MEDVNLSHGTKDVPAVTTDNDNDNDDDNDDDIFSSELLLSLYKKHEIIPFAAGCKLHQRIKLFVLFVLV